MSEIYVEVTKEHLGQIKDEFDRKATQFMIDFKNRRISYLMQACQPKRSWFGRKSESSMLTPMEAMMIFNNDQEERSLANQLSAGLDRLREIFVAAAASPAGTKFLVTIEDYKWFMPE
jgi:hypothetical protein